MTTTTTTSRPASGTPAIPINATTTTILRELADWTDTHSLTVRAIDIGGYILLTFPTLADFTAACRAANPDTPIHLRRRDARFWTATANLRTTPVIPSAVTAFAITAYVSGDGPTHATPGVITADDLTDDVERETELEAQL
ncbi:hypothetical protein [Actinokineospora enzanensis]|uniref:hypothetical protein n=1 Tax=Actinokineospora enzanensis TaxID=155975 RepID=UPI000364604E|nr:hypothetical protein [Actinokineospora enzanensis]